MCLNCIGVGAADAATEEKVYLGNRTGNLKNGWSGVVQTKDWIYYSNSTADGSYLYKMRTDFSENTPVGKVKNPDYINIVGNYIYCTADDGFYNPVVLRIKTDGTGREVIMRTRMFADFVQVIGDMVYVNATIQGEDLKYQSFWHMPLNKNPVYWNAEYCIGYDAMKNGNRLYFTVGDSQNTKGVMNFSTNYRLKYVFEDKYDTYKPYEVSGDICISYDVADNWIYESNGQNITKYSVDGTQSEVLVSGETCKNLIVAGSWVYFQTGEIVNRIKTNGTQREELFSFKGTTASYSVGYDGLVFIHEYINHDMPSGLKVYDINTGEIKIHR